MKHSSTALPLLLIIGGALWFAKTMNWFPPTAVMVAIALAGAGMLSLLIEGINKQSVVLSPLLMYAGAAVYGCYHFQWDDIRPVLALGMVLTGCLMLLARSRMIAPKYPPPSDLPPNKEEK